MSDHTQADAGRERDPIPTARESDQDRQALSAPWTSPPAPTRTRPPAPRPAAQRRLRLDAWRERGADRMDPVRFRFMEALGAPLRMPAPPARCWTSAWPPCSTPTRRTWSGTRPRPAARARAVASAWPRGAGLRRRRYAHRRSPARRHPGQPGPRARHRPRRALARRLELPLLDVYRDIWAKVSANRQLRQSEQQVPDNAGPLNSNNLVHRSLALMRQLSPAICTSSCPTWTRWPGWSSSMARWPLPKPRAVRPRLAPRVRRLSPPPPSAAGPRRPDAPSDLRRARCPQ